MRALMLVGVIALVTVGCGDHPAYTLQGAPSPIIQHAGAQCPSGVGEGFVATCNPSTTPPPPVTITGPSVVK